MCFCLRIGKNEYYDWLKNKDFVKTNTSKLHLRIRIAAIFKESKEIYGGYRIQRMLECEDLFTLGHKLPF